MITTNIGSGSVYLYMYVSGCLSGVFKIQKECILVSMRFIGTCFIQKICVPSSSLLQGKHLPFTPSPLRLNIFRLFVILSLTQLYRYTPEIFLFSTIIRCFCIDQFRQISSGLVTTHWSMFPLLLFK